MDLNSKRQQFKDRLDDISRGQRGLDRELLQSIKTWDNRLDSHHAEFHGELEDKPASITTLKPPQSHRQPGSHAEATLLEWFQDIEKMMQVELELGKKPLPLGFENGYELLDSEEAMGAAIAQACGLDQAPPDAKWKDYHLGVFHIPNQCTLINPSHFEKRYGVTGMNNHNRRAMAQVVSEIAMERWGWGFLLEYTTLGQLAGKANLWPAMLAHRARLPYSDQRASELARAIHNRWILLKTGWMDWVWQYVMFKAHHPVGRLVEKPRTVYIFELFTKLHHLFPIHISVAGVSLQFKALADLFKFLVLDHSEVAPHVNHQVILHLQKVCVEHDHQVRKLTEIPLSRILGRLYYAWLEHQVGILPVPYATLIAAYEPQIDLNSLSALEYQIYVEKDPRHDPDARLAMLSRLDDKVKYNRRSMFTAAWEQLKLEGPRKYFE